MSKHSPTDSHVPVPNLSGTRDPTLLSRTGVTIVGHGTRSAAGQKEFLETVRLVGELLAPRPVTFGYLELVDPDIPTAIASLAASGIDDCVVAPLLLFAAGHAKRDIPASVAEAAARHPEIRIRQADHLGLHEELLELSATRFQRAVRVGTSSGIDGLDPNVERSPPVATFGSQSSGRTMLVLVGRGSLDDEALDEMRQFTARRVAKSPVADARTCFLAMAKPSLAETLREAARQGFDDVVVQPHLLFTGELLVRARGEVERMATESPDVRWWWAEHLGPDAAVARALVARVLACEPTDASR